MREPRQVNDIDFSSTRDRSDFDGRWGRGYSLSDSGGQWVPGSTAAGSEWMQVDLGAVTDIAGVVTKGAYEHNYQVTHTLTLSLSPHTLILQVVHTQYTGYYDRRDKPRERYFSAPVPQTLNL